MQRAHPVGFHDTVMWMRLGSRAAWAFTTLAALGEALPYGTLLPCQCVKVHAKSHQLS